jgi:hypothetical protein
MISIGAEAEQSAICVVKNLFCALMCKGCGKWRAVYVLSKIALLKCHPDLSRVKEFLNFIAPSYTCGLDYSAAASKITLSKETFRPYTPTFMTNLALCCKHPIEERLYILDELKRTCYVCGENSTRPIVKNQFPLCAKVSFYYLYYIFQCVILNSINIIIF